MDEKERVVNNIVEMLRVRMMHMPLELLMMMEEDIETIGGGSQ